MAKLAPADFAICPFEMRLNLKPAEGWRTVHANACKFVARQYSRTVLAIAAARDMAAKLAAPRDGPDSKQVSTSPESSDVSGAGTVASELDGSSNFGFKLFRS